MFNNRRFFAFLPLYVLVAVGLDLLSGSPASRIIGTKPLPAWIVVAFILTAAFVVGISIWYLVRHSRGVVPDGQHNIYMALLAAVFVSGVAEDIFKGVAWLLLGGQPWWTLPPIYVLGYVIVWAVMLFVLSRKKASPLKSRPEGDGRA